ncbi:uncharacterized protein LOC135707738 [Ochlerotatus camptorhynchus]|uniref:uncharacterized protein LOC135707738 n=1 Tax=Ochlerotatus camptorhynchus TaxID=644619 RepID=UPI0031DE15C4
MCSNYLENLLTQGEKKSLKDDLGEVTLPDWYDEQKFKRAQQYFKRNFAAIYYATICGLLTVLAIPSILSALVFTTGKPSFRVAARRYLAALKHTINWYSDDLKAPGNGSFQSLIHVRRVHSTILRRAEARNYGIIISQRDMAVTQFAFLGYVILAPTMVGAQNITEDLDALCHFWRVFGYLLGMEDQFNLCAESSEETHVRMDQLLQKFIKPAFAKRTEKFEEACRLLLGGLWCFNLLLDYDALMYCAGRVADSPGFDQYWTDGSEDGYIPKQLQQLGWKSRIVLFVILSIHEVLMKFNMFRQCFNGLLIASGRTIMRINVALKL